MKKFILLILFGCCSLLTIGKPTMQCTRVIGNRATVHLYFNPACSGDTIYMELNDFIPREGYINYKKIITAVLNRKGEATVELGLDGRYSYFFLSRDKYVKVNFQYPLIDNYLIEANDNLNIHVVYKLVLSPNIYPKENGTIERRPRPTIYFSGRCSERFDGYEKYYFESHPPNSLNFVPLFNDDGTYNYDNTEIRNSEQIISKYLKNKKNKIDKNALEIFKADMVGDILTSIGKKYGYNPIYRTTLMANRNSDLKGSQHKPNLRKIIDALSLSISMKNKEFSKKYSEGCFDMEQANFLLSDSAYNNIKFYRVLKSNYSGILKDKLLYEFLSRVKGRLANDDSLIMDDINRSTINIAYRQKINELVRRNVGSSFYNFLLPNDKDTFFSLADFGGKVVLIDFYYLGCENCASYYQLVLKDLEEKYADDSRIAFISISADANKTIWSKSLQSGMYTSTNRNNVFNLYTAGKGFQHPILNYYNITGYPTPILIDKKGKIIEFEGDLRIKNKLLQSIQSALKY